MLPDDIVALWDSIIQEEKQTSPKGEGFQPSPKGTLIGFLNYKVYIHISFEEAKKRIIRRDSPEVVQKIDTKYHPTQRKYLHYYNPEENADMIIDNTDWNNPIVLKI